MPMKGFRVLMEKDTTATTSAAGRKGIAANSLRNLKEKIRVKFQVNNFNFHHEFTSRGTLYYVVYRGTFTIVVIGEDGNFFRGGAGPKISPRRGRDFST